MATLHRVFKRLDIAALEAALGAWLARTGARPIEAVALDGKTQRGIRGETAPGVQVVAADAHAVGAVLARVAAPGKGQELAAAKARLANLPVAGRVVTGDARLTQRAICARIVAHGGDYMLPVDDNQPALHGETVRRARARGQAASLILRPEAAHSYPGRTPHDSIIVTGPRAGAPRGIA